MIANQKIRLDLAMMEKGLSPTRQRSRALIMAGKVLVNNRPVNKPGRQISVNDDIRIKGEDIPYVSRGGLKLEFALKGFEITVESLICLDVGASTGGFTDCLLQHGAERVFSVDVGYGQLDWNLRQDSRVVSIERTNIRYLPVEAISQPVDVATIDVSFISLKTVIPHVLKFMNKGSRIIALIKPQFEVGKGHVGKGGVVRDTILHTGVINDLTTFFAKIGLIHRATIPSPILGTKGNKEFFVHLTPSE
jgi:23S rRNA (cytidine1920-2'-O)/16S rRNA (cytidine1409-2'-O)-methyltransferase